MKTLIEIDSWSRREHFLFFNSFTDPFFGITANVDFTSTYWEAKADKSSFFLYSLHTIMKAVNEIEAFRYRIEDGEIVCFDDNAARIDIIRFSPVPWFAFTEMKHATSFMKGDSAPRISTGKLIKEADKLLLPVNVTAHHGLMDGKHVADLLDRLS